MGNPLGKGRCFVEVPAEPTKAALARGAASLRGSLKSRRRGPAGVGAQKTTYIGFPKIRGPFSGSPHIKAHSRLEPVLGPPVYATSPINIDVQVAQDAKVCSVWGRLVKSDGVSMHDVECVPSAPRLLGLGGPKDYRNI